MTSSRAHVESGERMVQVDAVAPAPALFQELRKEILLCPRKTVAETRSGTDYGGERQCEQLGVQDAAVCSLELFVLSF